MSNHSTLRRRCVLYAAILCGFLFVGCAHRPYFVIENNTTQTMRIELIYDSLNIREIVARDIIMKKPTHHYANNWENPEYDSIKQFVLTAQSMSDTQRYLYDSLSLYSLLREEIGIANLDEVKPNNPGDGKYSTDFGQNAFTYYRRDSSFIKNILLNNTITFLLPPDCCRWCKG